MAASHTIDSPIAACNDGKIYSKKNVLETQDVETIIPEMESFCHESFRLNVVSSEECVFVF